MIALIRYTWRDVFRSQRWVAPLLVFLGVEAIIVPANHGAVLPTHAISATVLLFVATWLTIVTVNSEDPLQLEVTIVSAGSQWRVRMTKLLAAYVAAVGLGLIALIGPPLTSRQGITPGHFFCWSGWAPSDGPWGVTLGALCSRPIVRRTAWALLIAVVIDLIDVTVPSGFPLGSF